MLALILADNQDDAAVCRLLFAAPWHAKPLPTSCESRCRTWHARAIDRAAFEDLLWSLVNSAEFTTRR